MARKGRPALTLAQLARRVAELAPLRLAEDWDNVGLQVGDPNAAVRRVMTCLEVTGPTLAEAKRRKADAIVAHHPLIFRPMKSLLESRPAEQLARGLVEAGLGLVVAHTNLDSARWGTNEVLAEVCGLKPLEPLFAAEGEELLKFTVFTPKGHESAVIDAIARGGGGEIGAYTHCTFRTEGVGTFRGGEGSDPFIGKAGRLEEAGEYRLEAVVPAERREAVLREVLKAHPYEEPAYDFYRLARGPGPDGIGCLAAPAGPVTAEALARGLKRRLKLKSVRISGPADRIVKKIAICTGSGGSFLSRIGGTGAQAYITGEVTYHYGIEAHQRKIAVIELGHYETERIVAAPLAARLAGTAELTEAGVTVFAAEDDVQPFTYV
jgi:dinuclear metal center YbgI/SA1388 family protein